MYNPILTNSKDQQYHFCEFPNCGMAVFTDNHLDYCKKHEGKIAKPKKSNFKSKFNRWGRDTTQGAF